jgi:hypothetical protein
MSAVDGLNRHGYPRFGIACRNADPTLPDVEAYGAHR